MKKCSIALVCCGLILSGCNTMKGLGKDMMKVGESISRTAEKVQANHQNQKNQATQTQPQVIYSQHPTYTAPNYPAQQQQGQQSYPNYQ